MLTNETYNIIQRFYNESQSQGQGSLNIFMEQVQTVGCATAGATMGAADPVYRTPAHLAPNCNTKQKLRNINCSSRTKYTHATITEFKSRN